MPGDAAEPVLCFIEIDNLLASATETSYQAASAAFAAVDNHNVAVVLCSGHTRRTLDYLTRALRLWHPFVAEDGCEICTPRGYFQRPIPAAKTCARWEVVPFCAPRAVEHVVTVIAERLGIDILRLTATPRSSVAGEFELSHPLAARAQQRAYGEVVRLRRGGASALLRLVCALRHEGLRCTVRGDNVFIVPEAGTSAVSTLGDHFRNELATVRQIGLVEADSSGIIDSCLESTGIPDRARLPDVADAVIAAATHVRCSTYVPLTRSFVD